MNMKKIVVQKEEEQQKLVVLKFTSIFRLINDY